MIWDQHRIYVCVFGVSHVQTVIIWWGRNFSLDAIFLPTKSVIYPTL